MDALAPLFDALVDGRKRRFTVEKLEPFLLQFSTEDGFFYTMDQEDIIVEFKHRWRVKARSGSLPMAELISKAQPFTTLLPEVADRAVEVAALLNGPKARVLSRIGIVAVTIVALPDAPPGVRRLVDFISKPWKGAVPHLDVNITGKIAEADDFADRCIHTVVMAEDNPERLVTVKLDWQRLFTSRKPIPTDVVKRHVLAAQKGALDYFEDVAEGSRFDEEILSRTA